MTKRLPPLGYKAAIRWLAGNDDCEWLNDPYDCGEVVPSVCASMVADIYDRTTEEVTADLRKYRLTFRDG